MKEAFASVRRDKGSGYAPGAAGACWLDGSRLRCCGDVGAGNLVCNWRVACGRCHRGGPAQWFQDNQTELGSASPPGGRKQAQRLRDGKEQDMLGNTQEPGCSGHKVCEQKDDK